VVLLDESAKLQGAPGEWNIEGLPGGGLRKRSRALGRLGAGGKGFRVGARLDPKCLQGRSKRFVGVECPRAITKGQLRLHQPPVGVFVQGACLVQIAAVAMASFASPLSNWSSESRS
jgi:hypothetical protein